VPNQDTLWSAQEDNQLIGRIWRHPQKKDVHVYRLIADKTPDVFLNNISFDKAAIHNAFTGASTHLSEFNIVSLLI
jgi:SNF2 family DNA or RNA helicase